MRLYFRLQIILLISCYLSFISILFFISYRLTSHHLIYNQPTCSYYSPHFQSNQSDSGNKVELASSSGTAQGERQTRPPLSLEDAFDNAGVERKEHKRAMHEARMQEQRAEKEQGQELRRERDDARVQKRRDRKAKRREAQRARIQEAIIAQAEARNQQKREVNEARIRAKRARREARKTKKIMKAQEKMKACKERKAQEDLEFDAENAWLGTERMRKELRKELRELEPAVHNLGLTTSDDVAHIRSRRNRGFYLQDRPLLRKSQRLMGKERPKYTR
ncbi:hypothetical protein F4778DRAFT_347918 [Xylariomycetidae sp. FL2044]|nr:hypothetical protein F4778DRAFT_347918 [Xylariomycetidae sp. FL2044]